MRASTRTQIAHFRVALFIGLTLAASAAHAAAQRGPAADRARLARTARAAKIPTYERSLGGGVKRVYVNPNGDDHLRAIEKALPEGSSVLEILHMDGDGSHTLALFDRQLLHTQYKQGTGNWRLRRWGDALRPSGHRLYSSMISLTAKEAANLRARLKKAFAEQGPEHLAGAGWARGHLRRALGDQDLNCVSTWSEMPIGAKGEALYELIGLDHSYSGDPRGFQRALEQEGNERVFGISIYGPRLAGFGRDRRSDQIDL
jgi:hypothetical protein